MPPPFRALTVDQFALMLERFPFTRRINAVHMHHTWKPDRSQYRGHDTIVSMWRHHTETNRWSDIAQHVSIAPDGTIWLGRNWNHPPASAAGHNGNKVLGPFMFETIGNFDVGRDRLEGAQRHAVIQVIARVQEKFGLAAETLVFHNAMSTKTCPGSDVRYEDVLEEVREARVLLREATRAARGIDVPFPESALEDSGIVEETLSTMLRSGVQFREEEGAEHLEHAEVEIESRERLPGETRASPELSPEKLEELRPHLINLNMGQLSKEGEFKTSPGDVDAIFEEHLPKALESARSRGEKLRIVFWAHGGLVKESKGLEIAHNHIGWWKENGVYPIYFVWETGAFETIGQLLRRAREGATRALRRDIFDFTTDPLIQETVRALQGPRIWGGMKLSAELASRPAGDGKPEGGAFYAARKLADFHRGIEAHIELHAVGHSAGSIFHAHFIPAVLRAGVGQLKSLHLLAPAARVELFHSLLAGRIGNEIEELTIFTMSKSFERDDDCARIYRKSLLYLIYHALEPERKTPILGLEESIREDADLKKLLGLGVQNAPGAVVWSRSIADTGRSASKSTTHGGFDDDAATLESIARRVLGKADADPVVRYQPAPGARGAADWLDEVDWPEGTAPVRGGTAAETAPPAQLPPSSYMPSAAQALPQGAGGAAPGIAGGNRGTRRALCVGINSYPTAPLRGCVADAHAWARALAAKGFEQPELLLEERATREGILAGLQRLIGSSRPGDVVVFQFAGHGTQLPDVNEDEFGGDSPGLDEALCPYDFASGAFLIDDDLGSVLSSAPAGVNLTLFIDCCHSGTISRFGVGHATGTTAAASDERPRFINVTPETIAAHQRFRASLGRRRALTSGGPDSMPEILFSACLSHEVAWESRGHGEFTVRALQVLQNASSLTNAQFAERVTEAFGANPRQHARLYCSDENRKTLLLQPFGGANAVGLGTGVSASAGDAKLAAFIESLQALVQQLRR